MAGIGDTHLRILQEFPAPGYLPRIWYWLYPGATCTQLFSLRPMAVTCVSGGDLFCPPRRLCAYHLHRPVRVLHARRMESDQPGNYAVDGIWCAVRRFCFGRCIVYYPWRETRPVFQRCQAVGWLHGQCRVQPAGRVVLCCPDFNGNWSFSVDGLRYTVAAALLLEIQNNSTGISMLDRKSTR